MRNASRPRSNAPGRSVSMLSNKNKPVSEIGGGVPKGFVLVLCVSLLVIAAGILFQIAMPEGFPLAISETKNPRKTQVVSEIRSSGPIRINEIMTSNSGILTDSGGNTPDWIEVANIGPRSVDLKGYVLARNAKAGNVFVFPEMSLQPGECVVVYADSHMQNEAGAELHAPFRLAASGDVLMLFNNADVAIDTVNIPALQENTVYARVGTSDWTMSDRPTPGLPNTDESYQALNSVSGTGDVQIVELMSSNVHYAPDENGVCHDYVLLRSVSGSGADLSGWYLSDDKQMPRMWRFPQGASIPAGGTLLVHCSALNRVSDLSHLHTNFKLSSEGEQVVLSNAEGRAVDMVTFDLIKTDNAYVRGADGNWSVGAPTTQTLGQ